MNNEPNFTTMTVTELRAYVLAHREEEEALHAYIDKLHALNRGSQVYKAEDNVAEAIADYLKNRQQS